MKGQPELKFVKGLREAPVYSEDVMRIGKILDVVSTYTLRLDHPLVRPARK